MAERTYIPEQIKVIEHGEGYAVVSAVTGSGKAETQLRAWKTLGYETPADWYWKAVASIS
ncbi:hypothetical protein [Stenotrophomonas acidaminiphila]